MSPRHCLLTISLAIAAVSCGSAKFAGHKKDKKTNVEDLAPILCTVENNCLPKNLCDEKLKDDQACECDSRDICKIVPKDPNGGIDDASQNDDASQSDDGANQQSDDGVNQSGSDDNANPSNDPAQNGGCDDSAQSNHRRHHHHNKG